MTSPRTNRRFMTSSSSKSTRISRLGKARRGGRVYHLPAGGEPEEGTKSATRHKDDSTTCEKGDDGWPGAFPPGGLGLPIPPRGEVRSASALPDRLVSLGARDPRRRH